ncbi:MAG: tetraacyldisaccharide 4'-kinase [Flavobacteriales bacterium]
MVILRFLFFPFTFLFVLITEIRNFLYLRGILKSSSFGIPVIVIGNLSVGGTGKSPMTDYLVEWLKKQHSLAVLSRGYKRKTKGYYEVGTKDSSEQCGDEPLQLKKRHPEITVAVESNRVQGIIQIVNNHPDMDLILLDDAYQHRALKAGMNLVLTDFKKPFFTDFVLPTGNLRELRKNIQRADAVIVTKSPSSLGDESKDLFLKSLRKYFEKPVFFSSISYLPPVTLMDSDLRNFKGKTVLLVTGIADPTPLEDHLSTLAQKVVSLRFPDHYSFQPADLIKIEKAYLGLGDKDALICTTEKDSMRFLSMDSQSLEILKKLPFCVQKISIHIHEEEQFKKLIDEYLNSNAGYRSISQEQDETKS